LPVNTVFPADIPGVPFPALASARKQSLRSGDFSGVSRMSPTRPGARTMKAVGRSAAANPFERRRPKRAASRIDDRRLGAVGAWSEGTSVTANDVGKLPAAPDQSQTRGANLSASRTCQRHRQARLEPPTISRAGVDAPKLVGHGGDPTPVFLNDPSPPWRDSWEVALGSQTKRPTDRERRVWDQVGVGECDPHLNITCLSSMVFGNARPRCLFASGSAVLWRGPGCRDVYHSVG
jgi:hypothetical protein